MYSEVEIWKPIAGYNEAYEVSSHGRVRAKARTVMYKDGRSYKKPEHVFDPKPKQGYPSVDLPGGKVCIHSLVASAFIGPKPEGARTVNHKDGNKTNNHYANLEWATYKENNRHARITKLNRQHGEKCNLSKFGDDAVDAIRLLWPTRRFTQLELGKLFGMSVGHVHEILAGKSRNLATS
jgi:hypothetical protein